MFDFNEGNFLRERTVAEIVKNAFWIYAKYFAKIFPSYFVMVFPAYLLGFLAMRLMGNQLLAALIYLTSLITASSIAAVVITFALSEICLGEPPNLKRAWKHLSAGLVGKILATNLIFFLLIFLASIVLFMITGMVMLLIADHVPHLVLILCGVGSFLAFTALLTCLVFIPTIVVLENRWGFNAMLRSIRLGYGYHARNLIVVTVMLALVVIGPAALSVWLASVNDAGGLSERVQISETVLKVAYYLVSCLIQPLALIYIVLMYYDIRVRKESYDNAALEDGLRH